MKKSDKVIKDNVKPILTPIQKIRHTQASRQFVGGMSNYVKNYINGIKQMVNTKEVSKKYTEVYLGRAKEYVQRFNELKDTIKKQKSKIIPYLLIFASGGFLFYKLVSSLYQKIKKEMKHYFSFMDNFNKLLIQSYDKVLDKTRSWSNRFLNVDIDIQQIVYNAIINIPTLIEQMFNFICNGFDFLFNRNGMFQDMITNAALTAYNASFSTSWGWVMGLVFKRAKMKAHRFRTSSGWARHGIRLQREVMQLQELQKRYLGDGSIWRARVTYSVGGVTFSQDTHITTGRDNLQTYLQDNFTIRENDYKGGDFYDNFSTYFDYEQYYNRAEISKSEQQYVAALGGVIRGYAKWRAENKPNDKDRTKSFFGNPESKVRQGDIYAYIGPSNGQGLFQKIDSLYQKYKHLDTHDEAVTFFISTWKSFRFYRFYPDQRQRNGYTYTWDIVDKDGNRTESSYSKTSPNPMAVWENPHKYYKVYAPDIIKVFRLLWMWTLFDAQYSEHQTEVNTMRFHSRLQTSNADILKQGLLFDALSEQQSFENNQLKQFYSYYKNFEFSFQDYMGSVVTWMNNITQQFTRKNRVNVNDVITQRDKVVWRDSFNFGLIHRLLLDIKKLFNDIYYQTRYGMSYHSGGIYYFSDQVSDYALSANENKVMGSFDALRVTEQRDENGRIIRGKFVRQNNGIDVGRAYVGYDGVTQYAAFSDQQRHIDKSSLVYVVRDIIALYVHYRKGIASKRKLRALLLERAQQKLKILKVFRNYYYTIINKN